MKRIILGVRHLLLAGMILSSSAVFAATNYVVPWYANPVATNVTYDASLVNDPTDAAIAAKITTAWAAVSGADALSGKTALVKTMGDTTYFRPKFYVLCTDGDIVEFTMSKDLSSAVWTNTLTAAKLATVAGASGAATDLQVSDDSRLAFLNYGGTWKSLGYKTPTWTLHVLDVYGVEIVDATIAKRDYLNWIDADGKRIYVRNDILNSGSAYITDGTWQIGIYNYYGGIGLGAYGTPTNNAFRGAGVSEVLDLSAGTAAFAGGSYNIRASTEYALGIPAGGRTARVILHSTNLESLYKVMGGWDGAYEEIVFDAPKVTDVMNNGTDGFWSYAKRIVLNTPLLVNAGNYLQFIRSSGYAVAEANTVLYASESDWGDFNFPLVEEVGERAFNYFDCHGVLNLPSVKNIKGSAFGHNYQNPHDSPGEVEALLAPDSCTLTNIGQQAFVYITNLWRVVIGGAPEGVKFSGTTRYPQHFGMCYNLREVVFTGGTPSFDLIAGRTGDEAAYNGQLAHNSFDQSEKKLAFVIPRNDATWESFIEGSWRDATDAEIKAYVDANPGRYVPFGVVTNMDLFNSSRAQYIAYADTLGKEPAVTFVPSCDDRLGSVIVRVLEGNPADRMNRYEPGTVLELTAVPSGDAGSSFVKWYGDVGDGTDTSSRTITNVVAKDMWIYARFAHPWTVTFDGYGSAVGTAYNGNAVINVSKIDRSAHTLAIGKSGPLGLFAYEVTDGGATTNMTGSGIVDLAGGFFVDGIEYTATEFADGKGMLCAPSMSEVTSLLTPGTISPKVPSYCFDAKDTAPFSYIGKKYEMIVIDEPNVTTQFASWMFDSMPVPYFILRVPGITQFDNASVFWNCEFSKTKLEWWDLSGVESIVPNAFQTQWANPPAGAASNAPLITKRLGDAAGTLSLPNLRSVTTDVANPSSLGSPLFLMKKVTGFSIGGATPVTTVTNIGDRAFAGDTALKKLIIHSDANITVGTDIFADQWGQNASGTLYGADGHTPEEMVFTGAAPNTDIFANLLADIGAGDEPVKITVTKCNSSWESKPYIGYNPTAAEKALAGENAKMVFGVYRDAGVLKAIFIRTTPRMGFVLYVR